MAVERAHYILGIKNIVRVLLSDQVCLFGAFLRKKKEKRISVAFAGMSELKLCLQLHLVATLRRRAEEWQLKSCVGGGGAGGD